MICIHSRNISLMTTVNPFVNDCPNVNFLPLFLLHRSSLELCVSLLHLGLIISTLKIALANILRDVLVLLDVANVHQCSKVDVPYLGVLCVCFLDTLLSFPFHCRFIIWNQLFVGWKIFYSYFSVSPRHASLGDRSPESSEPYVTLDFPKFAYQNNIRSSYFFLPKFTLESISYSRTWRVT